jgi:hypothetical protein
VIRLCITPSTKEMKPEGEKQAKAVDDLVNEKLCESCCILELLLSDRV